MPDTQTWLAKFDQLAANPGDIQTLALQQVSDAYNGTVDIVDPSNPFIQLMEASAVNSAGAMLASESYTRKQYGEMAQSMDDLYTHMSDVDYLNRFAIPSNALFYLMFDTNELLASMVDTGVNGIKMLVIPRFTAITVNETTFTMQYPIEIRLMPHGGLQITYNNDQLSPVQVLQSNIVQWDAVVLNNGGVAENMIRLWIPIGQFAIASKTENINLSTGLNKVYPYTDQFYYCRAYSIDDRGNATEIRTTHTDQTFDPTKPTLLLKDLSGSLSVSLPRIYLTNRLVGGSIRVDIYTTKGDLSLALEQYEPNAFGIEWNGGSPADSKYVAPLAAIKTKSLYSQETTSGGSNGTSYSVLREQVLLNNFGPVNLPITPSQLSQALSNLGYESVINVDNVTDRIVLATRALPAPTSGLTSAGANMSIETLVAAFADLTSHATVANNGDRLTILPTSLFALNNGILSMVSDSEIANLKAMDGDALVRTINAANYMYTPLHYVLDATGNTFALRPYYLDNPLINTIQFVQMNETAGYSVATADKTIVRTATGYSLRLICQSSQNWKQLPDDQVFCQLAFIPEGEKTYAYLNGVLGGVDPNTGERYFDFDLSTNYDVDAQDFLSLTTFQMFDDTVRPHSVALTGDFDVFWGAAGIINSQTQTTQIDLDMGTQLLPPDSLGITRERLNMTLGVNMDLLWHRSRTVAGSGQYQVYAADVMATYSENVYQRDASGTIVMTVSGSQVQFVKLHSAGDPVLDGNGQPVVAHHAGDRVIDPATGQPILLSNGTLQRQLDLLMVEGVYYFASSTDAAGYADGIAPQLVTWLTQDLTDLSQKLLEKTSLYFYPKATLGDVAVLVKDGTTKTVAGAQTFNVLYYLDNTAWRDPTLIQPLTKAAIGVIANALQNKTVSLVNMQSALKVQVSSDVVSFDITGLGGDLNLTTLTVIDDSERLSIRKLAVVEADGTIGVEDGVGVSFVLHDTSISLGSAT